MKIQTKSKALLGGVIFGIALLLPYCGGSKGSSGLSSTQLDAIAEAFAFSALSTGSGASQPSSLDSLSLNPLANCTPQQLTPPYNCPGGGNIYFTIDLNCSGPSGCCWAQPDPTCSKDSISVNGMGSTLYNSCTTTSSGGDHIVINGTLTTTITSNAEFTCAGAVTVNVTVSLTGMPSITVNGKEVCKGDIFITAKASYSSTISASVTGTVCGETINSTFNYGCAVDCPDGCCPNGTICPTCSTGYCIYAAYPVDCCNGKSCPQGWTCVNNGNSCQLPTSILDTAMDALIPSIK